MHLHDTPSSFVNNIICDIKLARSVTYQKLSHGKIKVGCSKSWMQKFVKISFLMGSFMTIEATKRLGCSGQMIEKFVNVLKDGWDLSIRGKGPSGAIYAKGCVLPGADCSQTDN